MSTLESSFEMPGSDPSLSAYGPRARRSQGKPLALDELRKIDAYWRASLYLCMGMLYLKANPLTRGSPCSLEHTKPRLLGSLGLRPRAVLHLYSLQSADQEVRPERDLYQRPRARGAGGPVPGISRGHLFRDLPRQERRLAGMQRFFKQFSFPGGIGSHATPETPGSLHEGGELGYSLSHAYGTVYDNPDLIALAVVGDGEAETGPLATSWHSNKFLNPITDGAVLPVLHLNGYKINNPTILARIGHDELTALFTGIRVHPVFRRGQRSAAACTRRWPRPWSIASWRSARSRKRRAGPAGPSGRAGPMIILRSPKGWTAPREVDGHYLEGFWRAHQVPLPDIATNPGQLQLLESWMRSYKPEELFDANGGLLPELKALAPKGLRRMSANPVANGGLLRKPLVMPDFRQSAVKVEKPGATLAGNVPDPRQFPARGHAAEHAELPRIRPGRDAVQPAAGPLRGHQESMAGGVFSGGCRRRQSRAGRPRHGDAQRAYGGRLAGGLHPERPARSCSTATSRSSTSSTRWSTSTPSGSKSATSCRGGPRCRHSTC